MHPARAPEEEPCGTPDDVPTLSDGVVTLRAATADDLEGGYTQCTDPEMQRWTTVPVPYPRTDAAAFLARRPQKWAADSDWGFAIEAQGGAGPSRFAGSISIRPMGSGIGEIAYAAHPAVRGRGVMTRAVRLICDWAFDVRACEPSPGPRPPATSHPGGSPGATGSTSRGPHARPWACALAGEAGQASAATPSRLTTGPWALQGKLIHLSVRRQT
ncbi:MAG TPA: GNAT family N-acetyltransferase [Nocardioidaceae bacterium]|nr:GNAT family N-acetyltransferase [Nocardioidaceae bacterium]